MQLGLLHEGVNSFSNYSLHLTSSQIYKFILAHCFHLKKPFLKKNRSILRDSNLRREHTTNCSASTRSSCVPTSQITDGFVQYHHQFAHISTTNKTGSIYTRSHILSVGTYTLSLFLCLFTNLGAKGPPPTSITPRRGIPSPTSK